MRSCAPEVVNESIQTDCPNCDSSVLLEGYRINEAVTLSNKEFKSGGMTDE